MRFHCINRYAKLLGDLPVPEPMLPAEEEYLALLGTELIYRMMYIHPDLSLAGGIGLRKEGDGSLLQLGQDQGFFGHSPECADGLVVTNPEQVGAYIADIGQPLPAVPDFQKHIMNGILCHLPRMRDGKDIMIKPAPVTQENGSKSCFTAFGQLPQQIFVVIWWYMFQCLSCLKVKKL
jgi:hypothetical protein